MPIYDYQCSSCGFKKEVMRKISEPNLTACPECGKQTFTKQLSAPSFQLSGSGWYATDFKGGASKADSAKSEEKTGSEKKDGPEKKTESKEAATPAASCAPGCACH
jgi:putative FmdB family regulatory protein